MYQAVRLEETGMLMAQTIRGSCRCAKYPRVSTPHFRLQLVMDEIRKEGNPVRQDLSPCPYQ